MDIDVINRQVTKFKKFEPMLEEAFADWQKRKAESQTAFMNVTNLSTAVVGHAASVASETGGVGEAGDAASDAASDAVSPAAPGP